MIKYAAVAAVLCASGAAALNGPAHLGQASFETQRGFEIHSQESAPAETQEILGWYQENFMFVPHLAGVMAESPALLTSYWQLQQNLMAVGSLTPPENNIVQMSIAVANECQYCVAGHTMAGRVYFQSPEAQLAALRSESDLPEEKFNALRSFSLAVYENHGRVSEAEIRSFYEAGYTRQQALDVIANISAKVMSNFTNQLAEVPLDEAIKPLAEGLPYQDDRELIER